MEEPTPHVLVIGDGAPARHIGEALRDGRARVAFFLALESLRKGSGACRPGLHRASSSAEADAPCTVDLAEQRMDIGRPQADVRGHLTSGW